jgi:hypothetical protein
MANVTIKRETVTETLNGFVYTIEKLGAKEGRKLLASLIRAVGPAFEGEDAITKLCAAMTDAQLDMLCDTFAKTTVFSPENEPEKEWQLKLEFDSHFCGRYGAMTLWLKACLEANFGSFLSELGIDVGSLKDLMSNLGVTKMPTAPTSPSGASSLRASEG